MIKNFFQIFLSVIFIWLSANFLFGQNNDAKYSFSLVNEVGS